MAQLSGDLVGEGCHAREFVIWCKQQWVAIRPAFMVGWMLNASTIDGQLPGVRWLFRNAHAIDLVDDESIFLAEGFFVQDGVILLDQVCCDVK
ncbi:MAG: hypothetical protein ACK587_13755 [Cyanobacteriota bacterium]